ncbi:MAG: DUF5683 domain-containing protein [Alistipes sp.]
MRHRLTIFLFFLFAALSCATQAEAQAHRSPRTFVRKGVQERPDTTHHEGKIPMPNGQLILSKIDSSALASFAIDSLGEKLLIADSATIDSLRATLPADDTTQLARFDHIRQKFAAARTHAPYNADGTLQIDSTLLDSLNGLPPLLLADTAKYKKGWFMSDSMSLSKVCWISMALPGYGQIYNKQYWKLPILYGTLGAGLALFFNENKTYKPLKREYNALLEVGGDRTRALEVVQTKMIRSNTRRQLYLGAAIASYVYFIGDAAVNYATNEVSNVKKATTLACICPGAGQIYNKSYWKVPFVVGGFASMIYCIDWNNRGFQRFKKAYSLKAAFDKDGAAFPDGSPDEFHGRYSTTFLKNLKDSYRRNRDLCIIVTAGLYILQIVDAHVDAHLKDYDISDDLSMNIEPLVDYTFIPSAGGHRPVFGFNMSFNF